MKIRGLTLREIRDNYKIERIWSGGWMIVRKDTMYYYKWPPPHTDNPRILLRSELHYNGYGCVWEIDIDGNRYDKLGVGKYPKGWCKLKAENKI